MKETPESPVLEVYACTHQVYEISVFQLQEMRVKLFTIKLGKENIKWNLIKYNWQNKVVPLHLGFSLIILSYTWYKFRD